MIRKIRQTIDAFILISLFVHIALFAFLKSAKIKKTEPPHEQVEVEYVAPDELTPPEEQKSKSKAAKVPTRQIVEQEKQINDEIDDKTRFLSKFNQKVIKQTVADRAGKFQNTAQGGTPDEGNPDGDRDSETTQSKKAFTKKLARGEGPSLKDLAPKFSLTPGPKAPSLDENGNPSQTDDYVKDVNRGIQTMLSAREFVYYAYYNRIKEALRQHWEPTVKEKVKIIYRQGRTIASVHDRVTQVLVTLNPQGELIKIEVLTQSGVQDLDSAAVEAFKDAAPFPNPPKGMVESDGTIKIRWDFVLEA